MIQNFTIAVRKSLGGRVEVKTSYKMPGDFPFRQKAP
jgi:hypothetical protein